MLKIVSLMKNYGVRSLLSRAHFVLRGRVVTLSPAHPTTPTRRALLSFTTVPFTLVSPAQYGGHSNYWCARDIAGALIERGFIVDVVDFDNTTFTPRHVYDLVIDIGSRLGRIASTLPKSCTTMYFATGAHPDFQNAAELERIAAIERRRGVRLTPRRQVAPVIGLNRVDLISGVCGTFPASTYAHCGRPIRMTTVAVTHEYPFPETRDLASAKKHFIWFGGAGAAHKGLDLVLEAFARMPEYSLTVCGKFSQETDFINAYHAELTATPTIRAVGYIDPASEEFSRITRSAIGVISASCSEGTATSVVLAMGAGLIPIVNRETGVAVGDFGVMLPEASVEAIMEAVRALAHESDDMLRRRTHDAWSYSREHHSRARVGKEFRAILDTLLTHNTPHPL